jgi:phenylpyruvate tautomerase PptA (4-oxalocrotonate tautomerase family)
MPTYTVTCVNVTLAPEQESAIATAITEAHQSSTGAPGYFAQLIFTAVPAQKHYIGGKLCKTPHLYVHGLIRAGRSAAVKATLVESIAAKAREIAGVGPEDVWVYIQDVPAEQMVEFGRILPQPGAEEQWQNGMSASKRQELAAAGVPI